MMRQLSSATRILATAAAFALPTVTLAQADTRPVVVVYPFGVSPIGGNSDLAGIATGVQDLLITELASNTKYRLVDRTNINQIMAEQKLARDKDVDPETAVRLGKILGAQYAITGGWISDSKGNAILTARTIDIETTQIANPQKLTGKVDNVLDLLSQVATKVSNEMKLASKPGARQSGEAGEGGKGKAQASASTKGPEVVLYSKPVEPKVQAKTMQTKLDAKGMKLYSRALDAMDAKDKVKARELFNQVLNEHPDFEPAKRYRDSIS